MKLSTLTSNNGRVFKTFALYLLYLGMGLSMASIGPTLPDLQHKSESDSKTMSWIVVGRALGSLAGSILAGFVFDCFGRQGSMVIVALTMGIGNLGTPWWYTVAPMGVFMTITGIAFGLTFAGGSVWILDLWGTSSQPILQGLHFCYGIGNFISPFISNPFLAHEIGNSSLSLGNTNPSYPTDGIYVANVYVLMGVYLVLVSVLFAILRLVFRKDLTREEMMDSQEEVRDVDKIKPPKTFKWTVVSLTLVLMALYTGMENSLGTYLFTFVYTCGLALNKTTASYVTSLFWGMFALGRGLSILWALKVSPKYMLAGNIFLAITAGAILSSMGILYTQSIWAGAALIGLGLSSVLPTLYNWLEMKILVGNKISAMLSVASASGASLLPLLVGQFVDNQPIVLFYVILSSSVIFSAIYMVLLLFYKIKKTKKDLNVFMKNPINFD